MHQKYYASTPRPTMAVRQSELHGNVQEETQPQPDSELVLPVRLHATTATWERLTGAKQETQRSELRSKM